MLTQAQQGSNHPETPKARSLPKRELGPLGPASGAEITGVQIINPEENCQSSLGRPGRNHGGDGKEMRLNGEQPTDGQAQ